MKASKVGRYWGSYSWPTDEQAKEAFERCLAEVPGIGLWRSRHPMKPPHTHHTVFLMGESQRALNPAIDLCVLLGGEWYEPEPGLVASLRQRRLSLALEALATGKSKLVTRNRPRTLDKGGGMHDYKGEVE